MKRNNITRNQIERFYIKENHSIDECCKEFNISRTTFTNRLRDFNIKKSKKLSHQCSRRKLESKYGVGFNPLGDVEKNKKALIARYGVDNAMKATEVREKVKATNLKKYGVAAPIQNEEIFQKMVQTNLSRYDVACTLASPEIKRKANKTCITKYGTIYPLGSETHKELLLSKRKETNLIKYGAEEITTSKHFRDKVKSRCKKKYGTSSPNESVYSTTIFKDLNSFENYIKKFGKKKPSIIDIKSDLSMSETYILKKIHILKAEKLVELKPKRSSYEKEIYEFLITNNVTQDDIVLNSRDLIKGDNCAILELDIFIKSKNIAIEFNGTYWHSAIYKSANYHKNKSLLCEDVGIRLIHIYEYEWVDPYKKDIIKSILLNSIQQNSEKIYARKCLIKIPTKTELKDFLNKNHLQRFRGSSKEYGLYYNNELVQVMTFAKNKKYDWEIIREVSSLNKNIIGGNSKLFKHFLRIENPKSVFSYCDFNKFTGKGYEKIGMEFIGYTTPDMKWIIGDTVVNRNPSKNSLLRESADSQIFGAGSKKYLYLNSKQSDAEMHKI